MEIKEVNMKKLTLIVVITISYLAITTNLFSQPCLPEGVEFNTQEEIDNFQINYPDCSEIEGNVMIGGYPPNTDITNLNGLSVLTSIGGNLRVMSNDSLVNLSGLENVIYIGGQLYIDHNATLSNITALQNLMSIGDCFRIYGNALLSNLDGLENVSSIEGNIFISENPH